MAKGLSPQAMVQKRMSAKKANIHANKGMQSPYPAGIASTNRIKTVKAQITNGKAEPSKLAVVKKGVGVSQQPKVKAVKATAKAAGKMTGSKAGTSFGKC